jgi:hypothetical protein
MDILTGAMAVTIILLTFVMAVQSALAADLGAVDIPGNLKLSGVRSVIFTRGDDGTTHVGGIQFLMYDNGLDNIWTPTDQTGQPVDSTIRLGGFGSFNTKTVNLGVSGKLGIGTYAPTKELEVHGDSHLGGDVTITGTLTGNGSALTDVPVEFTGSNGDANTAAVTAVIKENTDCSGGRYEDNGDGTVSDCRTGLIWLKNAACTDTSGGIENYGALAWDAANAWAAGLGDGICGLTDGSVAGDWRLPTKTEWTAMVQSARSHGYESPALTTAAGTGHWTQGDIFDNVAVYAYWSSSADVLNAGYAWFVNMSDGQMYSCGSSDAYWIVWPVRAGQ